MSRETAEWLNRNVLVGFTEKRGTEAWHYRADLQGDEPNHYPGAIPVEDVKRRLFHWEPVSVPLGGNLGDQLATPFLVDQATGEETDVRKPAWTTFPDHQAIVRSDTFDLLGLFKSSFVIHKYDEWLLHNVAALLDADLSVGSAGLLKNGAQAWVSIEVPDTITTPEGVAFRPNLLACTSVDGSLSTTYKPVVTLTVCDNTMAAALGEYGAQVKIKHSRHSKLRIAEVRDALEIVHTTAETFASEVERLTQVTVTDKAWSMFLDETVPMPEDKGPGQTLAENKRGTLTKLWNSDTRVTPWKNTGFGVFQAVNTYAHHEGIVRNVTRAERNMDRALGSGLVKLGDETGRALDKVLAKLA